jgi:hypothetical protein
MSYRCFILTVPYLKYQKPRVANTAIWRPIYQRGLFGVWRVTFRHGLEPRRAQQELIGRDALSTKLPPTAAAAKTRQISPKTSCPLETSIYRYFLFPILQFSHLSSLSLTFALPLLTYFPIMSRVTPPVTKLTHAVRRISSSAHASHSSILLDSNSHYLPRSIRDLKAECSKRQLRTAGSKSEVYHYQDAYMANG